MRKHQMVVAVVMTMVLLALFAPAVSAAWDDPQLVWTTGRGHETAWDCPRDEKGNQYASIGDKLFIDWYNFSSTQNNWHYMYERLSEPNSAKVTSINSWGSYMAGKQGICDAEGVLVSSWTETPTPDSPVISSRLIVQPKMLSATTTKSSLTFVGNTYETGLFTVEITCTNISKEMLTNIVAEGKNDTGPYSQGFVDMIIWASRSFVVPSAIWIGNEWSSPSYVAGSGEVLLPGNAKWIGSPGDPFAGGIQIGKLRGGESFRYRFQVMVHNIGRG